MKKISVLVLSSMLMLATACSHEPTMADEFADLQLDNSKSASAPVADSVDSAPMDLDLTPPADPAPVSRSVRHRSHRAKKHSKKKVAKHKRHSKRDSELARSR